jgi:hypothetical protein
MRALKYVRLSSIFVCRCALPQTVAPQQYARDWSVTWSGRGMSSELLSGWPDAALKKLFCVSLGGTSGCGYKSLTVN